MGLISTFVFTMIFVAVVGAVIYSLIKFRWREGEPEPHQLAGHTKLEIVWTAIPLGIVLLLFALTARTMNKIDPPPLEKPDLIVTGHQFWWEASYPASGVMVANELHIPVGKPFCVQLEAADVIHEFWVAGLTRKIEAIPGQTRYLWLEASKAGTYTGVCTEFCGVQHAWMRFIVVAEEPAKFAAWQQAQSQPAAEPAASAAAAAGLALYQRLSCVSCHTVKGLAAGASVGPDLTHLASRQILGAGVSENTPAALRTWLKNPDAVKPGVLMPNYNLTDEQLDELGAYFATLK